MDKLKKYHYNYIHLKLLNYRSMFKDECDYLETLRKRYEQSQKIISNENNKRTL